MTSIAQLIAVAMWVTGWIIAKGFWSTFFAVIFAPYGWYLVISHFLTVYGIV